MLVLEYKVVAKIDQHQAIDEAIRTTQFIRNKCIRYWMDSKREDKINKFALNKYSTVLRSEFKFAKNLNSMAGQSAAERAWSAISRFFDNCKSKKAAVRCGQSTLSAHFRAKVGTGEYPRGTFRGKKGFPRFQKDNRSVEYKTSGWSLHKTKRRITITDKTGIGELKLLGTWDIHTYPLKAIKRVRLVRRADGYYCQFAVDVDSSKQLEPTGNQVGLDVGLEYFYSDSDGNHVENPRFLRGAEKKIKRSQRRIYKHKKGSNKRRKSRKIYARKQLKISRQRKDHAVKLARCVVQSNDLIAYENLAVKNMVKNHCLAKSINDVAWRTFRQWIEYFSRKYGRLAIAVSPHYTSQICSSCGIKVKKSLSQRTHSCKCGCILQRDVNAAIVILERAREGHSQSNAQGVVASTLLGATLVEQVTTMN